MPLFVDESGVQESKSPKNANKSSGKKTPRKSRKSSGPEDVPAPSVERGDGDHKLGTGSKTKAKDKASTPKSSTSKRKR